MLTYTEKQGANKVSYSNPFSWTRYIAPIYPIYEHDASGQVLSSYDYGATRKYSDNSNPLSTQRENIDLTRDFYLNQSVSLDATLLRHLQFSTTGNVYGNFYESNNFVTPLAGEGKLHGGDGNKSRSDVVVMTFNQLLRYQNTWKDYHLEALLGHESHKAPFGSYDRR